MPSLMLLYRNMLRCNKLIEMKTFTKYIFITLLLIATSYGANAQGIPRNSFRQGNVPVNRQQNFGSANNGNGLQRVQAIKEDFLGKKLQLSSDEAARFWPVYKRYQDEVTEVLRMKRLNNSDAQANGREQVKKNLEYDSRLVDIRRRYNEEFMKILPPEKVSLLYKGEREFNDELIRKINEH